MIEISERDLAEHMVWLCAYKYGNTYEVRCSCGWTGEADGDMPKVDAIGKGSVAWPKRAALWAAHVAETTNPGSDSPKGAK